MYARLSFRNAKRSVRDYLLFFVTFVLSTSLIYSFVSIIFAPDIMNLADQMSIFSVVILVVSVIMSLVIAFLIFYVTKFMLKKRRREFGTYILLGMEQRTVAWMFFLETAVLGMFSFVLGVLAGIYLSQIFSLLISDVFSVPYTVRITVSFKAVGVTLLFSALSFLVILLLNFRVVAHVKIVDLINERQNETVRMKSGIPQLVVFAVSLVLIGTASVYSGRVLNTGSDQGSFGNLLIAFGSALIGLYGLYGSAAAFLLKVKKIKTISYKGTNLFMLSQIASKVKTNSFVLGTLAVLLFITFVSLSIGLSFSKISRKGVFLDAPYDLMVSVRHPGINYDSTVKFVEEKGAPVADAHSYTLYRFAVYPKDSGAGKLQSQFLEASKTIPAIRLSDYNELRRIKGLKEVNAEEFGDGSFAVHVGDMTLYDGMNAYLADEPLLQFDDISLTGRPEYLFDEPIGVGIHFNGDHFLVVLPDRICKQLPPYLSNLVIQNKTPVDESFIDELYTNVQTMLKANGINETADENDERLLYVNSRTWVEANYNLSSVIFSFIGFYIGVIFTLVVATILALHQLIDSTEHRYRFNSLRKLGVEEKHIDRLVLKQLMVYFLLPLAAPIVIAFVLVYRINDYFSAIDPAFKNMVIANAALAFAIFSFIYAIYFMLTYFGFKHNIRTNRA